MFVGSGKFIPATEKCVTLTDYLEIQGHMILHDLTYLSYYAYQTNEFVLVYSVLWVR